MLTRRFIELMLVSVVPTAVGCAPAEEPAAESEEQAVTAASAFSALPATAQVTFGYTGSTASSVMTLSLSRPSSTTRRITTSSGLLPFSMATTESGTPLATDPLVSPLDNVVSLMPKPSTSTAVGTTWRSSLTPARRASFSAPGVLASDHLRVLRVVGSAVVGGVTIVRAEFSRTSLTISRGVASPASGPTVFGVVDFAVTSSGTMPIRVVNLKPTNPTGITSVAQAATAPRTAERYCMRSATNVPRAGLATRPGLPLELSELAACYAEVSP
ncbi:MAG: hypothetical protein JST00_34015 [Deltaproteobacteria bacterium]|nr:hypothetical protein [Deltaproteobacteria bacterium]